MANETIVAIEDGIITLLTPLKVGQPGGYLHTLETYGGEFQEAIERIVVRPPAVFVTFAGAEHRAEEQTERQRYSLLVADSALRSDKTGRRGGPAGSGLTGTYVILRDVRAKLDLKHAVADAGPLRWDRDELLVLDPTWSIYVATYTVDLTYQP